MVGFLLDPENRRLASAVAGGVYNAGAAVASAVGDGVSGIAEWSDERQRRARVEVRKYC